MHEVSVRLYRSSTVVPWGFRLQGGAGTSAPLSIQRVFAGGAADGHLNRGDVLISIDGQDVAHAQHFVAEDLIKKAGSELLLIVKRSSSENTHPSNEVVSNYPFPMQSGIEDYEHARSISEIRQKFINPTEEDVIRGRVQNNAIPGSTSYVPKRPVLFKRENKQSPEFGWVPKARDVPDFQSRYAPRHIQQVLSNEEQNFHTLPRENIRHEHYEKPAWLGTLRSSGGPKPWEVQEGISLLGGSNEKPEKVQQFSAPTASAFPAPEPVVVHQPKVQVTKFSNKGHTYEQKAADQVDSDSAKVAHLQYNSPMGLYSRENAQEAFKSQTGKFGGTEIQGQQHGRGQQRAPFDSAYSDVLRLVKEEDSRRKGQHHRPSPSSQVHHHQQAAPHGATHENRSGASKSARLEQLVHEDDTQQYMYDDLHQHQHSSQNSRYHVGETLGISDF